MDDVEIEDVDSENHRDMDFWKGFIIPAIFPFLSLICVILTIDMQITDYPILNKFLAEMIYLSSLCLVYFLPS